MGVNQGDVAYQAYQIINAIHDQATGTSNVAPLNHDQFVSVAQKVLAAGYDKVMNAITTVVGRTIIAVRPYDRKFADLEATADRWGGWVRKMSYGDIEVEEDAGYVLVDGTTVDPFEIQKVPVLELDYLGADAWQLKHTVLKDQLNSGFQDEASLMSFIQGIATHIVNLREQRLENFARQTLVALMLARSASESDVPEGVCHLVTEYNTKINASPALTLADLMAPDKIRGFFQFVIGRIAGLSRMMTERSELFQNKITGYKINRHTPREDQRLYMAAEVMETIATQVDANTYNEEFLKLPAHEEVSFWQAIQDPLEIQGVPPVLNADGTLGTGSSTTETAVLGILMDRDAAGYNVYFDEVEPSIYNPRGRYFNFFHAVRVQSQVDLSEKSILLLLD